jgi:hypothetical protein
MRRRRGEAAMFLRRVKAQRAIRDAASRDEALVRAGREGNPSRPAQDMEFLREDGHVGDCVRASTATILGLPRSDVPHFVRDHGGDWRGPWEDFIAGRGLIVMEIDPGQRPACCYLGCGRTVRTNDYRPVSHMVVMEGRRVAHDPHPSRAGLMILDRAYVLVPKRIADWVA